MCNEFSKDYTRILKYTKMNCRRNVADKFDMSPEDSEKKVKDIRPFFLSDHSDHMENRLIVEIVRGSQGSLNQFFSDSGDPSDYMEPGLKEQWGKHTKFFQSSYQVKKKIQLLVLSLQLISQLF